MGGRGSGSSMSSSGSSGANRTSEEKSLAKSLNQGDYQAAEKKLASAKAGSTVSVGITTYTKRPEAGWRGTDSSGYPKTFSTSEVAQEITARTYTGLKAKVKLKK